MRSVSLPVYRRSDFFKWTQTYTTTGDAVSDAESYAYYLAPSIQEQLDLDEENMVVRRRMAGDKCMSSCETKRASSIMRICEEGGNGLLSAKLKINRGK